MIPDELKAYRQWVCAKHGYKNPWRGDCNEPASVSDPSTWCCYEQAQWAVDNGYHDYVGFVFNHNGVIGIDIDAGYEDCELSETAQDIISTCDSYTEESRSGRGFHILLHGELPFNGKNNGNGVEIYQSGRYFILTGIIPGWWEQTRIIHNQWAIDKIVEKYFPETRKDDFKIRRNNPRIYNPEWHKPYKGKIPVRPQYPVIPQGSRNICLASLAGLLKGQGYNKKQIYNELIYANEHACNPALPTKEVQAIVTSIMRYKENK